MLDKGAPDPPTQRPRMETAMPRNYHPDGPEADRALTFTSDHSVGADQSQPIARSAIVSDRTCFYNSVLN